VDTPTLYRTNSHNRVNGSRIGEGALAMSYTLTLQCGCTVYVACDPTTQVAHRRVIERRGAWCRVRRHDVGVRLHLWEILPDPHHCTWPVFAGDEAGSAPKVH
jgi:hypothetical protein